MQKMQIELSYQDQIDLEKICADNEWTYSYFFKRLFDSYKKFGFTIELSPEKAKEYIENTPVKASGEFYVEVEYDGKAESEIANNQTPEEKPKRRGRPRRIINT